MRNTDKLGTDDPPEGSVVYCLSRRRFVELGGGSLVALAGCAGSENDGSETTASPPETETEMADTETPDSTTETADEGTAESGSTTDLTMAGSWPSFHHDRYNTGFLSSGPDPGSTVETAWSFNPPRSRLTTLLTTPVIGTDHVYTGAANGTFYALSPDSGEVVWELAPEEQVEENYRVVATATADIVFMMRSPAFDHGTLHAIDADSGEVQWTTSAIQDTWPTVVDRTVYQGKSAYDATTGESQWSSNARLRDASAVTESLVIGSNDGGIHALDRETGERLWSLSADEPGSPVVDGDTVYVATDGGNVFALAAETGEQRWTFELEGYTRPSTPAIAGDTLYASTGSSALYALDGETGTEQWRYDADRELSSPVATPGGVYVGGVGAAIALDPTDGARLWSYSTPEVIGSSATKTRVIVDDSYVYAAADDLYALEPIDD